MLLGKKGRKTRVEGRHGPKQGFQRALQSGSHNITLEEREANRETQSQLASDRNDPATPGVTPSSPTSFGQRKAQ